jgi:hypothetical protein
LTDLKITLVQAFGWSLHEINQTDIVDLLCFVRRLPAKTAAKGRPPVPQQPAYCDQVDWM